MDPIATDQPVFDGKVVVGDLNRLLRLRTTPIGMKMFASIEEMQSVPRIRRPQHIHTTDQIVGQASRNGWTVGITMDDWWVHNVAPSLDYIREMMSGYQVHVCRVFGTDLHKMQRITRRRWMYLPTVNSRLWQLAPWPVADWTHLISVLSMQRPRK